MSVINKIGRRKTAVARIYMSAGSGSIIINGREMEKYFTTDTLRYVVNQPFALTSTQSKYDIKANLDGGGISGQAEALRLAISRALVEIDADYRTLLKPHGLLRRDPRMVERKKPGQPKARKRFQFSKR
jgi:small subunit ribosomal protein S9